MKLRNIYITVAGCVAMWSLAGCSDFLEVQSDTKKVATESFKTIDDLRDATAYLYSKPWFDLNGTALYTLGDARGNNIDADNVSGNYFDVATFTETSASAGLENVWNSLYNVITQSCYVINDYAPRALSNGVNEVEVGNCAGEAHFMRGFAYWYLAMLWHDVPIIDDPQEYTTNYLCAPNCFEDVIQYSINDLKEAVNTLKLSDVVGRVTKYSAEAALARVYLSAANYAMGDHFSSDYLARNEASDNRSYAQSCFDNVKLLTQDIITNGTQYGLMEDYEEIFRVQNNNNKEELFALQWVAGNVSYGLGNPSQNNLAYSTALTDGMSAWGGSIYASYDFVRMSVMDGGRSRMRGNFFVNGEIYEYLGTHTDLGYWQVGNKECGETGDRNKCNIKKFVVGSAEDTGGVAIKDNTGQVTPMIRMSEVYLMYAEACIGLDDETTDPIALEYFNKVRERAFYCNHDDFVEKTTPITRNDMFRERRLEFFMEGLWWPDMVRRSFYDTDWMIQYMNNRLTDTDEGSDNQGLTYYIWYAYYLMPSYANGSYWEYATDRYGLTAPRKPAGFEPPTIAFNLPDGSYVHAADADATLWALPYPNADATTDPDLLSAPVKYNFNK